MQPQPTPKTVGEDDGDVDAAVLDALLESSAQRPWSVDEIARVIGDPVAAADSLARLFRAGLIHRLDNFCLRIARCPACRRDHVAERPFRLTSQGSLTGRSCSPAACADPAYCNSKSRCSYVKRGTEIAASMTIAGLVVRGFGVCCRRR